ncbi:LexA family transcriptional regulator [Azospirillum sp.]|uniref:LexA family transcriptional regulator n=1 Tax=Azospirillum sp. TaxID=34012 RepID=UPI003D710D83
MTSDIAQQTDLAREIQRRMKALKLTIAELERRAGVPAGRVKNILLGKSKNPRTDTIRKIAKALGCAASDLTGEDESGENITTSPDLPPEPHPRDDGGAEPNGTMPITELDVRASAGPGALVEAENPTHIWRVPQDVIRSYTPAPASDLKIITVFGDSMEPSLMPGQRVMVDTADTTPSPPGIFVVWDGLALVIKRVQVVAHSDPLRVVISSDNPRYQPYERTLAEAHIRGRVIGGWKWM